MQSEFFFFMQFLVTGLSMGSIYALVALGFVLIYKSTSILNLAQGEFMMVGAYICLSMTLDFGLNFFASFIITMGFSVLLGLAVERLVAQTPDRGADHIHHHGNPGFDLHPEGCGHHAMGQ